MKLLTPRGAAFFSPCPPPLGALDHHHRLLALHSRPFRPGGDQPPGGPPRARRASGDRGVRAQGHAGRDHHARHRGHRGVSRGPGCPVRHRGAGTGARATGTGGVSGRISRPPGEPTPASIVLRVEPVDGAEADGGVHLRVTVRDSGIGIPKDQQDKLFQAFTQADSSTSRQVPAGPASGWQSAAASPG